MFGKIPIKNKKKKDLMLLDMMAFFSDVLQPYQSERLQVKDEIILIMVLL